MAMKLTEVRAKTKTVTVTWDDETVDVCYAPNRFTPEVMEAVAEAETQQNLSIMGAMLEPLLEWWDVLDDNENRIPTSAENIAKMPLPFLMRVLSVVQEDQNPPASRG